MKIAVLKETAEGEHRVAATPETVKKFIALGAEVAVEAGEGVTASIADADYTGAGGSVAARSSQNRSLRLYSSVSRSRASAIT